MQKSEAHEKTYSSGILEKIILSEVLWIADKTYSQKDEKIWPHQEVSLVNLTPKQVEKKNSKTSGRDGKSSILWRETFAKI